MQAFPLPQPGSPPRPCALGPWPAGRLRVTEYMAFFFPLGRAVDELSQKAQTNAAVAMLSGLRSLADNKRERRKHPRDLLAWCKYRRFRSVGCLASIPKENPNSWVLSVPFVTGQDDLLTTSPVSTSLGAFSSASGTEQGKSKDVLCLVIWPAVESYSIVH